MKPTLPLFLFFLLLLTACSDAFDPFVESDQTFALYGLLDARRDTQFVRVQAIAEQEEPGSTAEARVTSTDLVAQETIVWQDSLVRLDDGTEGTAFFARFRPRSGRAYRIEAVRPDVPGAASEAVVRLPDEPPLQAAEPVVFGEVVAQRLRFGSTVLPRNVRVTYTVQRVMGEDEPVELSFGYMAGPSDEGDGFDILVALGRDAGEIRSALGVDPEAPEPDSVALLGLRVAYDLVDAQQAEVTGGVGSIGVAAAFSSAWTLAPEFVEALGFVDAQGGARVSYPLRPSLTLDP